MSGTGGAERRAHPRYPASAPVQVEAGSERLDASLRDVCRDAVLLASPRGWPLDSPVSLRIDLPGSRGPVTVKGRVARVDHEGDVTLVAVLFTGLSEDAASRIGAFVALQAAGA